MPSLPLPSLYHPPTLLPPLTFAADPSLLQPGALSTAPNWICKNLAPPCCFLLNEGKNLNFKSIRYCTYYGAYHLAVVGVGREGGTRLRPHLSAYLLNSWHPLQDLGAPTLD